MTQGSNAKLNTKPSSEGSSYGKVAAEWTRYSEWKSLLGFFSETEALGIVRSQGVQLDADKDRALSDKIAEAVRYVKSLAGRRSLSPEIRDMPHGFDDRAKQLQGDPTFQEHTTGISDWSLALVELDKLHVFQPNLNVEYVERLKQRAPQVDDMTGLLRFCLPLRTEILKSPVLGSFNPNTNTFTLTSENLDLRITGQMRGDDPVTGRSFVGFVYGTGLPQMSVVEYKGTYMIKNGYHRAYALYELGHKFLPCILVRTENYNLTGATGAGFFNIDVVTSDRSPILVDFDSPAAVTYPRRLARVIVSAHAEVQVVPV